MNLLKSTGIIGGMTLISRVFGFMRDMMLFATAGLITLYIIICLKVKISNPPFKKIFSKEKKKKLKKKNKRKPI